MRTGFFSSPIHSSTTSNSPSRHTTFSETLMEETINDAGAVIKRWDIDVSSSSSSYNRVANLFRDYRDEAHQFLDAVNRLQHGMHFVIKESSRSELLIQAQNLMQIAMKRLQKEMYTILSGNRYFLDSETVSNSRSSRASTRSSVSDEDDEINEIIDAEVSVSSTRVSEIDKVSERVMADLKAIADCMIGAGYGAECVKIYKLNRKSVVDETLYYLGVEKLTLSQVQKMDWSLLEQKTKNWLSAVKIAVSTLFQGEKILCDHVFSASDSIRETCFSEIAKESALTLFAFPEMVAKYKKLSLEKMFSVLDLYNSISELWDEIELIFSFNSLTVVKSQAVTSLVKLGEAARFMLSEFESAIQKDSSKAVACGGVHPLTRYVMNYLVFLGDYSGAFSEIIVDWPLSIQSPLPESYFLSPTPDDYDSPSSAVSVRLAWLVLVLLCKLDGKAQHYKDVSLSYLFLANNLNYVVSKVKKSNLKLLLGSDWLLNHDAKVKQYISNYERMGWSKVLTSFLENSTAEMSPPEARDWFVTFNSDFEEAYRTQSSWVIPDPKLRDGVKISLAKKVISGYRTFYEKYREILRSGGVKSVVRFAPDDLQNYLSDLFHGTGSSEHGTTSYSLSHSSPSVSTSSSPSHGR
ncbi:exocyst complex component EXO70H1 [Nicotiana tabacum]|uniref:Exocyst subunit Exo70 family protein n=1 Tax=Nicotiana tabacum TaxID=4097 RepID=A0A1S4DIN3_TOBAC|nr:PREDICTED: exocyst complex component EXO70A1-like [Nicotiana tabacum]